ncbi:MAG: phytochelatin synthase family protein [Rugosibacter sp.]|jgi:hypothetical protein|nr:hypothetical protein [Rugosibacter sp.]
MNKTKKAVLRGLLVVSLASAAWSGWTVWNTALRAPSFNRLPVPQQLIAGDSATGQQLFVGSGYTADYDPLMAHFVAQVRPAFCGVASSVVVLNALPAGPARQGMPTAQLTQHSFFDDAASQVRNEWRVTFGGMTLAQLRDLLNAHGANATATYASDTTLEAFRELAKMNLKTPGDYLLVNYQRGALGQRPTGHISPLAAYNAASDRFLILDVAAYKYPPVWVKAQDLWAGMNATDPSAGRTRGFVAVKAAAK